MILRAVKLMLRAHSGQFDKMGYPYHFHPLRVASCIHYEKEALRIAALLHDVVEDGGIPLELIREDFGPFVADIVGCLTRRKDEPYFEYIGRVEGNPLAARIKLLDLRDNLLDWRVGALSNTHIIRYREALKYLEDRE